jgi:hypothetical protein
MSRNVTLNSTVHDLLSPISLTTFIPKVADLHEDILDGMRERDSKPPLGRTAPASCMRAFFLLSLTLPG